MATLLRVVLLVLATLHFLPTLRAQERARDQTGVGNLESPSRNTGPQAAAGVAPPNQLADQSANQPAKNCKPCQRTLASIQTTQEELEKNKQYLGKNREFLFLLSSKEAKFLKVKGNEQMILKNLDRIKAKLETFQEDYSRQKCQECEKESVEKYDGK